MTLTAFLDQIYIPLRLRGRSENSVRLLRHAIRQFSLFLGRDATVADFGGEDADLLVSQFLAARAAKGLAPHSVARERSGLMSMWNLAQARGLVRLRPCVRPELLPKKTPRALTAEELERLVESAAHAAGWIGPILASTFWRAFIGVAFYTGERYSAIFAAPKSGWRRPFLTVPATVRKGRRDERIYEVPPEVADLLDQVGRHDLPTLFPWTGSDMALRKRWKVITRRAGLGDGREVQFHALRRSCASHLEAGGGDATEALGHSSERITRASYLDPRIAAAARPKVWQILPRIIPTPPHTPPNKPHTPPCPPGCPPAGAPGGGPTCPGS